MVKDASFRLVIGGAVGLFERAVMGGGQVGKMCGVSGVGGEVGVGCGVATHSR